MDPFHYYPLCTLNSPLSEDQNTAFEISTLIKNYQGRYIAPRVLREIFKGFMKWRKLRIIRWAGVSRFEQEVTHYLVERCYWIRYGDSEVVTEILKTLFAVDGHLGKIFCTDSMTLRTRRWQLASTTWSKDSLDSQKVIPLQYYTEHANKQKTIFHGKRLPSQYVRWGLWLQPCAVAWQARSPDALLYLLRYGALQDAGFKGQNSAHVSKLLRWTIGTVFTVQNPMDVETLELAPAQVDIIKDPLLCGNILLRAVPSVNIEDLFRHQGTKVTEEKRLWFVRQMSSSHLMPKLRRRCSTEPVELMHACRLTIRQSLYANWELPCGITYLPLPNLIKRYLNLEFD